MKKEVPEAISILTGTTIGAGVLAIPYVISQAGFITGLLVLVTLGIAIMLINLYLGEVILRTKGDHQLPGYSRIYLGKVGWFLNLFAMLGGIYGAIIAYLIGEGLVFKAIFGGNELIYSIIFFIFASLLVYRGVRTIAFSELFLAAVTLAVIISIALISFGHFEINNLTGFSLNNIFIPYGVILFAYLGTASIPEIRETLIKNKKKMKKSIILGTLIPIVVYIIFAFAIVGATGINTTEMATIGLGNLIPDIIYLGNLFAIFAMLTSFLTLALALEEMFNYDFKLTKAKSWMLSCLIPFILFLFVRNFSGFKDILNYTGVFAGGLEGILVVLMFLAAKKYGLRKPEYEIKQHYILSILLVVMFLVGIIITITRF